jgi:serine/threonine protein kinase
MVLTTGYILNNRYRIVKLLGQGGFGAIYRAWDLSLRIPCAIKHNTETSPQAERQFVREATLLANLTHPHLPRVTDYFSISGQGQYLVMDYIEGEDLQEKLEKASASGAPAPLPVDQALIWMQQVCDALGYLHGLNPPIIHRDIKPANIRITSEGKAYLVDFGIAKAYDPHIVTTVAAKAVTPGYSPPEQYSGVGTDVRTDIYALGATLYTLVTGLVPPESVFRTTGHETLRLPRSINPAISTGLQDTILKAMEIYSGERFQNIQEFRDALNNPDFSLPVAPTARYAQQAETPASQPVVQPYAQPVRAYPNAADQAYPGGVAESARSGGFPWLIIVIGAVAVGCVVLGGLILGSGALNDLLNRSTPTPVATYTQYPTYTSPPPTQAPRPTATVAPSSTPPPTATELPPPTDTLRPTQPPPTDTRPPTAVPASNITVRIRNRTSFNANLYRIGLQGESHFLGWLVPGYYGIYTFPSLDDWTIEYCRRDTDGSSYDCRRKSISVTANDQEFNVP